MAIGFRFGTGNSNVRQSNLARDIYDTEQDPNKPRKKTWLEQELEGGAPEQTAPLSAEEQTGLEAANAYARRPAVDPMQAYAGTELYKTLTGDYDPSTSPYYEGVRSGMERNEAKSVELLRQRQKLGGVMYSGRGIGQEADLLARNAEAKNRLLGDLGIQERGYRFQAVPQAMAAGREFQEAPLRTARAMQEFGALPRQIQQNRFSREYQNRLEQTKLYKDLMDDGTQVKRTNKRPAVQPADVDPLQQSALVKEYKKRLRQKNPGNEQTGYTVAGRGGAPVTWRPETGIQTPRWGMDEEGLTWS